MLSVCATRLIDISGVALVAGDIRLFTPFKVLLFIMALHSIGNSTFHVVGWRIHNGMQLIKHDSDGKNLIYFKIYYLGVIIRLFVS